MFISVVFYLLSYGICEMSEKIISDKFLYDWVEIIYLILIHDVMVSSIMLSRSRYYTSFR